MKAYRLSNPRPAHDNPLSAVSLEVPDPGENDVLLKVSACGICHTDLHIVEGDLPLPKLPLIPGHQIVGTVERMGKGVLNHSRGDRCGVPWLSKPCGVCEFCRSGRENLCDTARFTGYHIDGGYAEYVVVPAESAYPLPAKFTDIQAAPLLCAGVIGLRALRLSEIKPGGRIGLYGFGASAHIALQILLHWGCKVYVFSRTPQHREFAASLGAVWTGPAEENPPEQMESTVIFAPAGQLVPLALRTLRKGGTIALAGIHMSPIPQFDYHLLYNERTIRSVANSTRTDVRDLLDLAGQIGIRTEVETFPLAEANIALQRLKRSEMKACGVLVVG